MESPMNRTRYALLSLLVAAAFGCAEDLTAEDDGPPPAPTGIEARGDGTFALFVDATDDARWVYVRLDEGVVDVDATWDLAFRRFTIAVNGGASGPGAGLAARGAETALTAATRAPDDGWQADRPDGDDPGDAPDRAFDAWYAYDEATHILSPEPGVWYVRSGDGARYYAVAVEGYYDAAGSAGHIALGFTPVDAPDSPPPIDAGEPGPTPDPDPEVSLGVEVDARDGAAWTYLQVDGDGALATGDESRWDIAFQRSNIRLNGGGSGPGLAAARIAPEGQPYETIESAPTTGYIVDAEVPAPGPPGAATIMANPTLAGWYDYDPASHQLSPGDRSYLIRTADGRYARMRITAYTDGLYRIRFDLLPAAPEVIELTAEGSDDWSGFDLAAGAPTAADGQWDLALRGVRLRTAGGTSGEGQGAAQGVDGDTLDALGAADDGAWQVDEMLPEPGPPGSGEYSGNPALADWYDYDPMTHQVSPKARIFAVRLRDGGLARMRIVGYTDDRLTVRYQYAGAGRTSF